MIYIVFYQNQDDFYFNQQDHRTHVVRGYATKEEADAVVERLNSVKNDAYFVVIPIEVR